MKNQLHQGDSKRLLDHLQSPLFDDLDLRYVLVNAYELWVNQVLDNVL
jgi:hypothetical protein